jgi:signal transduction histidine kinase
VLERVGPVVAPQAEPERVNAREARLVTLGLVAASIAHELGNPLTIISSTLQFLHAHLTAIGDSATEMTEAALENVERMHRMLRQLHDVAAVRGPSLQPTDLGELVTRVLAFAAPECRRRAVTVRTSFEPGPFPACVDRDIVSQLLLNLVKNAYEAMTDRGGTLTVRVREARMSGAFVVEFENDGPPIPEEMRRSLFEPFHTTKPDGTGLGLFLSKRFARDHQGDVAVTHLPSGVRFTVTLPLSVNVERPEGEPGDGRERSAALRE